MSDYFVRILDLGQVHKCHQDLERISGRRLPIDLSSGHFCIKAPDGDEVFMGVETHSDIWIVRFHKHVFDENTFSKGE